MSVEYSFNLLQLSWYEQEDCCYDEILDCSFVAEALYHYFQHMHCGDFGRIFKSPKSIFNCNIQSFILDLFVTRFFYDFIFGNINHNNTYFLWSCCFYFFILFCLMSFAVTKHWFQLFFSFFFRWKHLYSWISTKTFGLSP